MEPVTYMSFLASGIHCLAAAYTHIHVHVCTAMEYKSFTCACALLFHLSRISRTLEAVRQ